MDNRFGMVGRMMNFFRMMNLFGSNKKIFNEEIFIKRCLQKNARIRNRYNIDKGELEKAKYNEQLEDLAATILKGYTQDGIVELAKQLPGWDGRYFDALHPGGSVVYCVPPMSLDQTDKWVDRMLKYYEEICKNFSNSIIN